MPNAFEKVRETMTLRLLERERDQRGVSRVVDVLVVRLVHQDVDLRRRPEHRARWRP